VWRRPRRRSATEFLDRPRAPVPSCLIVDLPELDGLDVQRRVAADRPETPVVFTGCADVRVAVQAMKAGAMEFLAAPWRDEALVDAIEYALERSRHILERQASLRGLHESYRSLTPREREVMVLVVSGLLNKQVGRELGISEITVEAHRGQVVRKMKAASLPALVHMVSDLGLRRRRSVDGAVRYEGVDIFVRWIRGQGLGVVAAPRWWRGNTTG
jgi:FixJ family two-component response regulator